jgi:hypothetical protein
MPKRMTNLNVWSRLRLAGVRRAICRMWLCLANQFLTMRAPGRGKKAAVGRREGISHLFSTVLAGNNTKAIEGKEFAYEKRTHRISGWLLAGYNRFSPNFMFFSPISQPECIDFTPVTNKTRLIRIPAGQKKKFVNQNRGRTGVVKPAFNPFRVAPTNRRSPKVGPLRIGPTVGLNDSIPLGLQDRQSPGSHSDKRFFFTCGEKTGSDYPRRTT